MSDRIIFDDAINHIAAAESLSNAETSALKSELIRDALCHALKVYPRGSRVKYDFNEVYSQVPSAKFGSGDRCTVKTSEVEVYFNDLDKWLEFNWPQLEFRLAKANPSSASDTGQAAAEPLQIQSSKKTPQIRDKALQQMEAIVTVLERLGYEPLNLPALVAGNRSAKADARESLDGSDLFQAPKAFENAWQLATQRSHIKTEKKPR